MEVSKTLRASWYVILIGALLQACANLPQSAPEANGRPSPTASGSASSAPSRTGGVTSAPPQGSAAQPSLISPQAAQPPAAATPEAPPTTPLQSQLGDGIRLFEQGEFYAAAGRLRNLPDLQSASKATQIIALKYLAFSYCVTNRRTLCQRQFESALKLDPNFELAPAERGHPIWKVVYERAKSAMRKAPPPPPPASASAPKTKQDKTQTKSDARKAGRASNVKATQEKAAQDRAAQDKMAQDKVAQEEAVQEKVAQEKAAQEKVAQDKATQERARQDKANQEKPKPSAARGSANAVNAKASPVTDRSAPEKVQQDSESKSQ